MIMHATDQHFLETAIAEGGQPISAGGPPLRARVWEESAPPVPEIEGVRFRTTESPDLLPVGPVAHGDTSRGDYWTARLVAAALGLVALTSTVGAVILSTSGREIPGVLIALGSGALGVLAGSFTPYPPARR